ncbi:hypothetical protein ABWU93_11420 [Xanthomonas translucens pv. translucens]|uniref:hypothetical protein n=1 Tax=Xanthomonas campestris pv. translucens TaxID=343 RepID=UPI003F6FD80F
MKRRGFLQALGLAPLAAALPAVAARAVAAARAAPTPPASSQGGVVFHADRFTVVGPAGEVPFAIKGGQAYISGGQIDGQNYWRVCRDGDTILHMGIPLNIGKAQQ